MCSRSRSKQDVETRLGTETDRPAAIGLYLQLRFEPDVTSDPERDAFEQVSRTLRAEDAYRKRIQHFAFTKPGTFGYFGINGPPAESNGCNESVVPRSVSSEHRPGFGRSPPTASRR